MRTIIALVVGAGVAVGACAGPKQLATWAEHPTHFASGAHLAFSARNGNGGEVSISETDLARAQAEQWWGDLLPPGPPADVAGRWSGEWRGRGIWGNPRGSRAEVLLVQTGARGQGRLRLADTEVVGGVPDALRLAGSNGVPVSFEVRESEVWMRQTNGAQPFLAVLTLEGDRLVGRFQGLPTGATLILARTGR
jgi:hypothetical protein